MALPPDDTFFSHYALLGVPIDADIGQIRAAYLRLMKKAHPDLKRRRTRKSPDPSALNEAYRVLRDSRRRMAYDLTLRRKAEGDGLIRPQADGGTVVRIARRMPPPPPPPSLSRRVAMAFCVLLVGGAIGMFMSLPSPLSPRPVQASAPERAAMSGGAAMAATVPADPMPTHLWVDGQMVTRAVDHLIWIRRFGRPVDALRYSRNCFEELSGMPSALLLDHCVAFDLAAATWLSGRPQATVGFSPRDLQIRHQAALAGLPEADTGNGQRLGDIKQATVAALVRRIDPEARPPAEEMIFPADSPPQG